MNLLAPKCSAFHAYTVPILFLSALLLIYVILNVFLNLPSVREFKFVKLSYNEWSRCCGGSWMLY